MEVHFSLALTNVLSFRLNFSLPISWRAVINGVRERASPLVERESEMRIFIEISWGFNERNWLSAPTSKIALYRRYWNGVFVKLAVCVEVANGFCLWFKLKTPTERKRDFDSAVVRFIGRIKEFQDNFSTGFFCRFHECLLFFSGKIYAICVLCNSNIGLINFCRFISHLMYYSLIIKILILM